MPDVNTTRVGQSISRKRWNRVESTTLLSEFERARTCRQVSQRQFSQEATVPRTTLQHWLERKATLDASPEVRAFFRES